MDHQQFIVYYGRVVAKNWSSLLIEVTICRRSFLVMPENGTSWEFGFPNPKRHSLGIFSYLFTYIVFVRIRTFIHAHVLSITLFHYIHPQPFPSRQFSRPTYPTHIWGA